MGIRSHRLLLPAIQGHAARLALVELRTGPRIGLGDYGGPTIHPYAIGNAMSLGGANYLNTLGGGVSLNWPVNETITITPGVEFRNRWFSNSANYPTAAGQTGGQWIGYVFGSGLVSAPLGLSWQSRISFTDAQRQLSALRLSRRLGRFRTAVFFRGAGFRAYGFALDAYALGRVFVHPLCRARPDRRPFYDAGGYAMAGRGGPGHDVLSEPGLLAAGRNISTPTRPFRTIVCRISS